MDDSLILDWVNTLPEPASPNATVNVWPKNVSPNASKKRKAIAISGNNLASPPSSCKEADDMTSTPQRKRRFESQGALFDPDVTPRAGSRSIPSSSASISASETSSTSRVSAKKQKMSLRLAETGVEKELLTRHTVPEVAKMLFRIMMNIGRGHEIIPAALKPTIKQGLADENKDELDECDLDEWKYAFKHTDEPDNLPGQIPSFTTIEDIVAEAAECEKSEHEENHWNVNVYSRLLKCIFGCINKQHDFNTITCTSARPYRGFIPIPSAAKMIDICVYASLDQNQELKAAMAKFSNTTPTLSVNHTDFLPTQFRPFILSIETKKPGVGGDLAQLQIGVWHAAQWAFLRWAVGQKLLRQRQAQGLNTPTADEEKEFKAKKLAILLKLGFIPGIIIQGNRWYLVISTYNDGKTTLWAELAFGTTMTIMETYAVIAGVRELTAWARDTYLPWFKENVLTLT
ncbi:hypothetical protein V8C37DRAFT_407634 [Trichoderma ceciliae]